MHLQAGEWALEFRDGDLWHIRAAGVEAVERVYFALRDERWSTVPFRVSGLSTEAGADGFRISFDALHDEGGIRFRWRALIEGDAAGIVRFRAAGEAQTSFRRNRIGLCVHHPQSLAGRELTLTHTDGRREITAFPVHVSPHQPAFDIRAMRYSLGPGRAAEITFSGETWEMEDQRNWSDANFKTYPTPLALPFPVTVAAGARVEQTVELRLRYEAPARALPLGLALDSTAPAPANVERLHRLRLAHLRLEQQERLGEAARWNLPIELALEVQDEAERQLSQLDTSGVLLARVIVYRRDEAVASPKWLEKARARFPNIPVLPGSSAHFAELNRNRGSDFSQGVAFPLHPQVHAFDAESIMANLASHDAMFATVRAFAPGAPVYVSPVRFAPLGSADPRLSTGLGAAWTRGAIANFSRLGAAAATFHSVGAVLSSPALEQLFSGGSFE